MRKIAFGYAGGKNRIASKIIPLLPDSQCYCEPFAGSLAVYLNKPQSHFNLLNDFDNRIVNFFTVLRDRPNELIRAIELTPRSRTEHGRCIRQDSTDPLELARQTFVSITQSVFKSTSDNTLWQVTLAGGRRAIPPRPPKLADRLNVVVELLQAASFECGHGNDLLERIAPSPDWLIYCDPPYLATTTRYKGEFSVSDHERLLALVCASKAKVAVSGYRSDLYDTALAGWTRHEFSTVDWTSVAKPGSTRNRRLDCLWVNY